MNKRIPCNALRAVSSALMSMTVSVFFTFRLSLAADQALSGCAMAQDPNQGVVLCTQVIQSDKVSGHELAVAYDGRGAAYVANGKYELAIADYTRALEIDPKYVEAYVDRALAYNEAAQYDLAIADAAQALKINPNFSLAYYSRGFSYTDEGKYDLAMADYNHILAGNPTNRLALESRAIAYFGKGQYALSAADYNEVIHEDPGDPGLYDDRGRVLFAMGNFVDAIRDFGSAVSYDRANHYSVIWLHLARARAGSSRVQELVTNSSFLDHSEWPMPIVQLYLGNVSSETVLRAGSDVGQRCEAYFYTAEWNIIHRQIDQARNELDTAGQICPRDFGEYFVVQAEIARLRR